MEQYGVWDQIRVDHGREFYLMLYVQEMIRSRFGSSGVLPYVQSKSTEVIDHDLLSMMINFATFIIAAILSPNYLSQNLTIERIWPEVNQRVNYPIKRRIIEMEENGILDMDVPTTKFCVSFICVNVATVGIQAFIQAWNRHPIAGNYS